MDLRALYLGLDELQQQLQRQIMHEAEVQLTIRPQHRTGPDYRTVQALAAAYTLQDYVAGCLAEQYEIARAVAAGELPEDPED